MSPTTQENEPIFFWRPHEEHGYLGQWFSSPFTTPSPLNPSTPLHFKNCESYMMYHKALLFNDHAIAAQILAAAEDPKQVKALGRQVKGFEQGVWNDKKFGIVVQANLEKFGQSEVLREWLVQTGGR